MCLLININNLKCPASSYHKKRQLQGHTQCRVTHSISALKQPIKGRQQYFSNRMWGNSIGDEGAEAFAEALRNHPSLTNLSLSANGITSRGGRSLSEALKENSVLRIFW
ncbi:hypothetical protein NQZ68_040378 [Dissostichus eleginoides]|nr:hypothetical protein NQZ68_040378 [Dissostichus eleginoides]